MQCKVTLLQLLIYFTSEPGYFKVFNTTTLYVTLYRKNSKHRSKTKQHISVYGVCFRVDFF